MKAKPRTLHLRPVAGQQVPMPEGGYLPARGKRVADSPYWRRRLASGSCERVPAAAPAQVPAPAAPPTGEEG